MSFISILRSSAIAAAIAIGASLCVVAPANAAVVLTASPAGTSTSCSATAPCSVATAVSKARAGDSVILLAGAYGAPSLTGVGGTATAQIQVKPATGASVTFEKLQTSVPGVRFSGGIVVTRILYIYPAAINTTIDGIRVNGGGAYIRGSGSIVRNSIFENGTDIDAVQIKDGSNISFERNIIRNYASTPGNTVHVDCLQVFDAKQIRVTRNSIRNCSNAGVILSPGAGLGIQGVTLSGNFIQSCVPITTTCRGGSVIDVTEASATGVVVRNNTLLDGFVRNSAANGAVFDRNIVGWAECKAPMTNSIVIDWNHDLCAQPTAIGTSGNRLGMPAFANRAGGDLHTTDRASVSITPTSGESFVGYDGILLLSTTAGADD